MSVESRIAILQARGLEPLAKAIWSANWAMNYEQYKVSGPTPDKAWSWLDPSKRLLYLLYAQAAVQYLGNMKSE